MIPVLPFASVGKWECGVGCGAMGNGCGSGTSGGSCPPFHPLLAQSRCWVPLCGLCIRPSAEVRRLCSLMTWTGRDMHRQERSRCDRMCFHGKSAFLLCSPHFKAFLACLWTLMGLPVAVYPGRLRVLVCGNGLMTCGHLTFHSRVVVLNASPLRSSK